MTRTSTIAAALRKPLPNSTIKFSGNQRPVLVLEFAASQDGSMILKYTPKRPPSKPGCQVVRKLGCPTARAEIYQSRWTPALGTYPSRPLDIFLTHSQSPLSLKSSTRTSTCSPRATDSTDESEPGGASNDVVMRQRNSDEESGAALIVEELLTVVVVGYELVPKPSFINGTYLSEREL